MMFDAVRKVLPKDSAQTMVKEFETEKKRH
jgi:hypothetical protein